jgi:enamine deaminase RidA (YjgF/YER057c/UK114 family)
MGASTRLKELGITLPEPITPVGTYVGAKRHGNLIYLSAHGPMRDGRPVWIGRVGREVSPEEGYQAAHLTALNLLATARRTVGDLDRLAGVVKLYGMVSAAADFYDMPKVINGASDLFVNLFGEEGLHARTAVGLAALPFNMPVAIEAIFAVH